MNLDISDFPDYFEQVHGFPPFPWQQRLLQRLVDNGGQWPPLLDLPTGSGKTATIDIAVFHLALEASRGAARRAPLRIAFVVDRRLVVDDVHRHAQRIATALDDAPSGSAVGRAAAALHVLSEGGPALNARRLRGGLPMEGDWARTPTQPTVLSSTVDQVGSRLLFRGYGVSDSMKPVHAGLLGSDCLLLLDEAHLAEPFRQTLGWVRHYRGRQWRKSDDVSPWAVTLLTATPGESDAAAFTLADSDRGHPLLARRLRASKPAWLVKTSSKADGPGDGFKTRVSALVGEVVNARKHFSQPDNGAMQPAIAVVVNRVARARAVHARLRELLADEIVRGELDDPVLMIGPARATDREHLTTVLDPIRTRAVEPEGGRRLQQSMILVATQCIEAGVDIDLDALITELAPLDALRQRFGRLNRGGRAIAPFGAVVAGGDDLSKRTDDPVYGAAMKPTWDVLNAASNKVKRGARARVDFGIEQFSVRVTPDLLSPRSDAPVLLPAHLDLLSQTSPVPAADPEIGLFLHGTDRQQDAVSVVWRADILDVEARTDAAVRRLLATVPPRAAEAIELPIRSVQRWLSERHADDALADVAVTLPDDDRNLRGDGSRVAFLWRGDDERSRWIHPGGLRAGDTIVVPATYGGVDLFGWNPDSKARASDVYRAAAEPFADRHFVVRVAPGLMDDPPRLALADALARVASEDWRGIADELETLPLPDPVRDDLQRLRTARRGRVIPFLDLYGEDEVGHPCGVVFIAPFGLDGASKSQDGTEDSTEDDTSGSLPGYRLTLARHSADVESQAQAFAARCLPEDRVVDLRVAGYLHDMGKADPRFQAWLSYGDPLGPDPEESAAILAKSDRPLPRAARRSSALPDRWRHEALSVRLALSGDRLQQARDPELALWLIGTHHGHGRPLFPHADADDGKLRRFADLDGIPRTLTPGHGPQSLAFDWRGFDWAQLFERLKARYGVWELARMEAIVRLADHRASERARLLAASRGSD